MILRWLGGLALVTILVVAFVERPAWRATRPPLVERLAPVTVAAETTQAGPGLEQYADYRSVAMGRVERPAVVVRGGQTFVRTVAVPSAGARYQTAFGAIDGDALVRVSAGGLKYTFTAHRGSWTTAGIDLHARDGSEQQMTISFEGTGAGRIAWAGETVTAAVPQSAPRTVILISLDTTRLDQLTLYQPDLPTTPRLAALLPEGVLFERAISTSSWTMPAHAALFTGHLAADSLGFTTRLEPPDLTMAERFAAAGYRTFGVSGGPFTDARFGFQQGFDEYVASAERENARDAVERAVRFIDEAGPAPVFVFLNLFNAHEPLELSPDVKRASGRADDVPAQLWYDLRMGRTAMTPALRARLIGSYQAEIAEMDRRAGDLLDALKARDRWRDALVVVWGDHGQLLGDRGRFGHGLTLEEELIRIPLFIRLPAGAGIPPGMYPHLFQNDDAYALCLSLAGLGDPLGATLIEDVAARRAVRQLAFAKLYHEPSAETMREPRWRSAQQWAVRSTEMKVVRDLEGRLEAYDVTDPTGERPVELPPPASPIMQALDRFRAGTDGSTRRTLAPLSPAERDRLRALGYIR